MGNENKEYISNGSYCEKRHELKDWETKFTPEGWDSTNLFFTLRDCCVTKFWWDIEGCIAASPKHITFTVTFDVENMVDPYSCQDADTIAHGLETAMDINLGSHALSFVTQLGCV